jgi:hypothetical protein
MPSNSVYTNATAATQHEENSKIGNIVYDVFF